MKEQQDTNKSQLERTLEAIKELVPNITEEDRKKALKACGISNRAMLMYVTEGTGKNLDTAIALLKFFRKRISDREELIGQ